jgi:EAL domain-containing protein (putative c-di-GMP-specific phosphodiesterase class I)
MKLESTSPRPTPNLHQLPNLAVLLGQIEQQLMERGELGILSVTVIRRREGGQTENWDDYETILREISIFLERFSHQRLRSSDIVLAPILAGNTFVVLIGPPREARALHSTDVVAVRQRMMLDLSAHIAGEVSHTVAERFGVYVGGSLMHYDASVEPERIIYRALEEAIADALNEQEREEKQQSVHLRDILEAGEVTTVYQPVVDVVARRVIGFEALTRLPRAQFETPDVLFKVANEQGVLWSLERLCRKRALEYLPPLAQGQLLFLNIEPDSMHDPELRDSEFLDEIERAGLNPRSLVLEVTEHAAVRDFAALRKVLDDIRALGFRLAMDDVGAGYSGLQTIAEIRPDYIKVDMTLVRDMHLDPFKRELITTIRRFTDNTGIVLVAEGVENVAELQSLADAGVRCAQGFLFARPNCPPHDPDWTWLPRR